MNPGDVLNVVLKKHVEISESEKYWVAETSAGERFLIDSGQYLKYGFSVGQNIKVTVDKINCSGKIFIEPDHPVYSRGKVYSFPVSSVLSRNGSEVSLVVKDVFDNEIPVLFHVEEKNEIPESIELLVIGLRKALPVLLDPALKDTTPFHENEIYTFMVTDKAMIRGEKHFQLEDKFGRTHLMPASYYEKYPIETGKPLDCYVVRIGQNAELSLEPVHPVFRPGVELDLTFGGLYSGDEYIGKRHRLYVLHDDNGNEFFMSVRFLEGKKIPQKMHCRIEKMKKGQALVEPVL